MFRRLIEASQARRIEAQTNDVLLTLMLYDCATGITSDTVVFHDALTTNLAIPGAIFREVTEADKRRIFEHKVEGVGDMADRVQKAPSSRPAGSPSTTILRTATIYMEVDEPRRRRGYGSS